MNLDNTLIVLPAPKRVNSGTNENARPQRAFERHAASRSLRPEISAG